MFRLSNLSLLVLIPPEIVVIMVMAVVAVGRGNMAFFSLPAPELERFFSGLFGELRALDALVVRLQRQAHAAQCSLRQSEVAVRALVASLAASGSVVRLSEPLEDGADEATVLRVKHTAHTHAHTHIPTLSDNANSLRWCPRWLRPVVWCD